MHIPEWEVEELLKCNPALLGFASNDIELVERQKYLAKSGRYIDLLFKHGDSYLIVEIKSSIVNDKSVVVDQLLEYKRYFAEESGLPPDKIICVLVSPNGFTEELEEFCHKKGIMAITLDKNKLIDAVGDLTLNVQEPSQPCLGDKNDLFPTKTSIRSDIAKKRLSQSIR